MAKHAKATNDRPDAAELSFEQATEELEAIIDRIEQGEIGLQESLAERKRGETLIQRCRAILDQAEQELEQMTVPAESTGGSASDGAAGDDDDLEDE
jgi:exodeoxyribonuclease VII small subunit